VTETAYAIVVGDGEDPHVRAVVEQLPGAGLVIIDAVRVPAIMARLGPTITTITDVTGAPVEIRPDAAVRGWIRRLAPAGWDHGVTLARISAQLIRRNPSGWEHVPAADRGLLSWGT
jgi:hypothetical protein